ncbi:MAG: alpha/beta hydrolase [Actinobacteria bacterium]|nr:alpha/beta hydrolase [Actinomycetota bacterium]
MASAAVNGTVLHYEALGDGASCVVVPGWPGVDHTYLRPGLERLAGRLRLVFYDQRGHGRSARPAPEPLSLEQLADDAGALAAYLGAERTLALGHYHGASVALELALRHPSRVAGLVLVAATPGQLGSSESLADTLDATPTPPEVQVLQRVPPASDAELEATMHALAPFLFHDTGQSDPRQVFAGAGFDARTAVQVMQPLHWWSAVERLGDVRVPVLLLTGRHDVFCPPSEAERIRRKVPHADLVVLEHSGHLPWVEEPDAFDAAVHDWLAGLPA